MKNLPISKTTAALLNYLTKQYIDNELAVDKSKNHWEVFSQHLKPLIHCLKRYEDASLSQRETSQKSRRQLCWKPFSGKELLGAQRQRHNHWKR